MIHWKSKKYEERFRTFSILLICSCHLFSIFRSFWSYYSQKGSLHEISQMQETFFIGKQLFLKSLSIVSFGAFCSLIPQILGLIGKSGILPVRLAIRNLQQWIRFRKANNVQVLSSSLIVAKLLFFVWSDGSTNQRILFVVYSGAVAAFIGGICGGFTSTLLFMYQFVCYLCIKRVSGVFLNLQWDSLLLESLILSTIASLPCQNCYINRLSISIVQFLFFRLMFASGVVKVLSGDVSWRNMVALFYHFETQPLPNSLSFYAHHLHPRILEFGCVTTLFIEIFGIFFMFSPSGRFRIFGWIIQVLLEILIASTGSYGYFNFLIIALSFSFLDDYSYRQMLPSFISNSQPLQSNPIVEGSAISSSIVLSAFVLVSTVYLISLKKLLHSKMWVPNILNCLHSWISVFFVGCHYGLFANMTVVRNEVVIEGSTNETEWVEIPFRYKPCDINKRPMMAPIFHMPRVDWRMWFLPFHSSAPDWFYYFLLRILEGNIHTKALLGVNSNTTNPPKYIRAVIYTYNFNEPWSKGPWWKRKFVKVYVNSMALPKRGS